MNYEIKDKINDDMSVYDIDTIIINLPDFCICRQISGEAKL